jgi:hypothetical protein
MHRPLGLAFQVVDDILDVTGDAAQLGKTAGKDAADGQAHVCVLAGAGRCTRAGRILASTRRTKRLHPWVHAPSASRALADFIVNCATAEAGDGAPTRNRNDDDSTLLDSIQSIRPTSRASTVASFRCCPMSCGPSCSTSVSQTGGHLSSNLGTVELTIALHYVFNTPHDRIVWDVGHQTYPHKILTGRRDQMHTLRQLGGISGFPRRRESEYDTFGTAHSSTSISARSAWRSRKLQGENRMHCRDRRRRNDGRHGVRGDEQRRRHPDIAACS